MVKYYPAMDPNAQIAIYRLAEHDALNIRYVALLSYDDVQRWYRANSLKELEAKLRNFELDWPSMQSVLQQVPAWDRRLYIRHDIAVDEGLI
jgi:hypothetical protein